MRIAFAAGILRQTGQYVVATKTNLRRFSGAERVFANPQARNKVGGRSTNFPEFPRHVDLKIVNQLNFDAGVVAMQFASSR